MYKENFVIILFAKFFNYKQQYLSMPETLQALLALNNVSQM